MPPEAERAHATTASPGRSRNGRTCRPAGACRDVHSARPVTAVPGSHLLSVRRGGRHERGCWTTERRGDRERAEAACSTDSPERESRLLGQKPAFRAEGHVHAHSMGTVPGRPGSGG